MNVMENGVLEATKLISEARKGEHVIKEKRQVGILIRSLFQL